MIIFRYAIFQIAIQKYTQIKKPPFDGFLVRGRGLEPPCLTALPPQGSAATITPPALEFTISPHNHFYLAMS